MSNSLWADNKQVGIVTEGMFSRLSGRSMALARLDVPYAEHGVPLEIRGSLQATASSHSLPFDDPDKQKRIAKG